MDESNVFSVEELEKAKLNVSELDGKLVRLGVTGEGKCQILFALEENGKDSKIYVLRVDEK